MKRLYGLHGVPGPNISVFVCVRERNVNNAILNAVFHRVRKMIGVWFKRRFGDKIAMEHN